MLVLLRTSGGLATFPRGHGDWRIDPLLVEALEARGRTAVRVAEQPVLIGANMSRDGARARAIEKVECARRVVSREEARHRNRRSGRAGISARMMSRANSTASRRDVPAYVQSVSIGSLNQASNSGSRKPRLHHSSHSSSSAQSPAEVFGSRHNAEFDPE